MQRIICYKPGSYDVLKNETNLPIPEPSKDEVLIKVSAIGVNYADVCIRMNLYSSAKKYVGWPDKPIVIGFEFSGIVSKIGQQTTDLLSKRQISVGTKVFGVVRFGAYQSHIVAPSHQIFPIPDELNLEEAAAFPSTNLTAYYALKELVNPRPNQIHLVHSAAGGVGSALIQLCKAFNCKVIGVVGSSAKVDIVKSLGADYVIDKSTQNLWAEVERIAPEGVHAAFDANGVETLQQSWNHLASSGRLIIYGFHTMLPKTGGSPNWLKLAWDWLWTPRFNPLEMTSANKSVMAFNLSYMFEQTEIFTEMCNALLQFVKEKKLKIAKVTSFNLSDVESAHKLIESGTSVGKLVLIPDEINSGKQSKKEK